jgi:polyisoprenoid-binding protein YceI
MDVTFSAQGEVMAGHRTLLVLGGAVGVVVAGVVGGPLLYAALEADAAAAPTVQAQPAAAPLVSDTDGTWNITSGSSAGYRVHEVLNGADVIVAGTTDQVTGSVDISGGDLSAGHVTVDVASIATDQPRRDSYFRDHVMDVATQPTATFAVTAPADLPELTGTPVTVSVAGDLTLAGTTQPVQADLSVVRTADGVEVSGSIPVTFADYGVDAPSLGFVRVDDAGAVEFFLALTM